MSLSLTTASWVTSMLVGTAGSLWGQPKVEVPPLSPEMQAAAREAFEDRLRTDGWTEHAGHVVPPPPPAWSRPRALEPASSWFKVHRSTIFLNFWGVPMLHTGSNAALDESTCLTRDMPWPGFKGSEEQALAIVERVKAHFAPYGVRIAFDERPPSHLPYAMVLFGGTPDLIGVGRSVVGTSCSSDCGDQWWRDTTLVFTENLNVADADAVTTTAVHEAAHAFGLTHVDNESHLMYPFVTRNATWGTMCADFDTRTGNVICRDNHLMFCDGGQNSHAELLAMFGPDSPDTEPPTVAIASPPDGLELSLGSDVVIEAAVSDNFGGAGWKLSIPELEWETVAFFGETSWPLTGLPVGVYTLRVEAIDHDRNTASDEVRIYVGVPAGTPSPLDESSEDEDALGCGCKHGPPHAGATFALLLGWLRRKRRARGTAFLRPI